MNARERIDLSPWGAVVLSAWLAGFGQIVAGRVRAGVFWLLTLLMGVGLLVWSVLTPLIAGFSATFLIAAVLAVLWLFMLVDAYRSCPRPAAPGATLPNIARKRRN